jgi:hypothetical protein
MFPQIAFALNNLDLLFHHLDLLLDERRQRSEQYLTSSQTAFHFLRQAKGRPHIEQIFCGRSDFFIMLQSFKKAFAVSIDCRIRFRGQLFPICEQNQARYIGKLNPCICIGIDQ